MTKNRYGCVAAVLLLLAFLCPITTLAQNELVANPLQPPDLSSPRATLRGFIKQANAALQALDNKDLKQSHRLRIRLEQMLDFSKTANGFLFEERSRRMLYLKEILDRIVLPLFAEIPGEAEVAENAITRWAIPNTRIFIVKIMDGERAGEFVFSAASVALLHSYYRQVRHLPYQSKETAGWLEKILDYQQSEEGIQSRIRSRLRPVDTSNPDTLLQQFLASVNAAYELMMQADMALRANPPEMTRAEAREAERQARIHMARAVSTLDLSEIPEAQRRDRGLERALMIKEVLDRALLVPTESVPDTRAVDIQRQTGDGKPMRWRFPNTDIEIIELSEGPQAGEFRFSARTVENAANYYNSVRDLPYRGENDPHGAEKLFSDEYLSPAVSAGFYRYYASTPGSLIPGASWLGSLVMSLPAGLSELYFDQTLWQWLGILFSIAVAILLSMLVYAVMRVLTRRLTSAKSAWLKVLVPIFNAGIVFQLVKFIDADLNTTAIVNAIVTTMGALLFYLLAAAAVFRLIVAIGETCASSSRLVSPGFDASLVRLGVRVLGFFVGLFIVVNGARALGLDLVPLIAGLGIGGLAVALAVRPTLENLIGGVILYADKPIRVGDYCTFGGQSGTVENVGLRSTKIRAIDRTLIIVPNAAFADMQLVNWARCDKMLITTVIGLRYETTSDQLRNVLARLRRLCFAHPKIETETLRIRFSGFGSSSLDVTVRVYALTNEWNEYHAIREDLYLRFAEAIEALGTSIAFPSSTLYVSRDSGLDPAKVEIAENEVAAWREAGELPFPRTPEPLATRITDSLDYPPKGSPEARHQAVSRKLDEPLSSEVKMDKGDANKEN